MARRPQQIGWWEKRKHYGLENDKALMFPG